MTHYVGIVVCDSEEEIDDILWKYDESLPDIEDYMAKWDWWVIGGRWGHIVPGNSCKVKEVRDFFETQCEKVGVPTYIPSVIVDKDGWYALKDWGWFGAYIELDNAEIFSKKLEELAEKTCYIIDFHI